MKTNSTKALRSYKLSALCRRQVSWLRKRLGFESDTAVHEFAISQLFQAEKSKSAEYLVPLPLGDGYSLYIGSTQVATVSSDIVAALPQDFLSRPMGKRGSLLSMLVFTHVREGKGTMTVDRDALASLHVPQPPTNFR
jgi:hypothetical protein